MRLKTLLIANVTFLFGLVPDRGCAFVCFCVTDLGVVRVLESQAKVVSLQQVQMAAHHVQEGLAFGKFLLQIHAHTLVFKVWSLIGNQKHN